MPTYHVTEYYLATGMEGVPYTKDHGYWSGKNSEDAMKNCAESIGTTTYAMEAKRAFFQNGQNKSTQLSEEQQALSVRELIRRAKAHARRGRLERKGGSAG